MPRSIPEPSLAGEVVDLLHQVNHRLRRASVADLEPRGVTPAQVRALRMLHRGGGSLRMSDLADQLGIARRSATSVVDELEERRLVRRADDPTDRRAVLVVLDSEGRSLISDIRRRRHDAATAALSGLNEEDLRTLGDLLRRINP